MKRLFLFLLLAILFQQTIISQWVYTNGPYGTYISGIAVSGANIFAEAGGVFLSTNNGTSWEPANTPFPHFNQMVQMGQYLFAGTENGVFFSTDNGTSWTVSNNGLPSYQNGNYKSVECFAISG